MAKLLKNTIFLEMGPSRPKTVFSLLNYKRHKKGLIRLRGGVGVIFFFMRIKKKSIAIRFCSLTSRERCLERDC